MKTIIITMILGVFMTTASFSQTKSGTDNFEVRVDGMGCAFCAKGLEMRFQELKQIEDIKIDLESGTLTFSYPATALLTSDDVVKQVHSAGYTPVSVNVERFNGKVELVTDIPELE